MTATTPLRQKFPVNSEPLRWLFVAHFDDGTIIEQDQEDKSQTRTDGTGSRFTDVLAKDGLEAFELINCADPKQFVYVDLITGNFNVNGTPLSAHNQHFDPTRYKLELVYFREARAEQNVDQAGEIISQRHFVNRYFIGWQTKVNNKVKQVTLAVG